MEKELELYHADGLRLAHGRFEAPDSSQQNMHHHPQSCEILCIHQCKGVFHVEGSAYPVNPGDLIVIQPNEAHYMEVNPSAPYDRTVIRFQASLFDSMDPQRTILRPFFERQIGKRNLYRQSKSNKMEWSQIIHSMRNNPNRQNILFKLTSLLELIYEEFSQPYLESEKEPLEYRIMQYIKENLHEQISTQTLCDRFFISRTQLHQRFIKATGISVGRYIAARRMMTAQQLITQGGKPTDIYTQCGFRDYSTFYRAYLKYHGHSPNKE